MGPEFIGFSKAVGDTGSGVRAWKWRSHSKEGDPQGGFFAPEQFGFLTKPKFRSERVDASGSVVPF
jgi:hypothetical protein